MFDRKTRFETGPITINELKENEYITDEEKAYLIELEKEIWNSDLIFRHDDISDEIDFDATKLARISDILKDLELRRLEALKLKEREVSEEKARRYAKWKEERPIREAELEIERQFLPKENRAKIALGEIKLDEVMLEDLDLSVRSFNCLKRAGIDTLSDLSKLTFEGLGRIRNLGKSNINEVIAKLGEYGLAIGENDELITDEDKVDKIVDETPEEKSYSESEIEKIRGKKRELEAQLKALDEQTRQAKELLAEYNKLIGDDKINTDDDTSDFKEE